MKLLRQTSQREGGSLFIMSFKTQSNAIIARTGLKRQPEEAGKNPQILQDNSHLGKERPWSKHKLKSGQLAESYKRLNLKSKASRVNSCGGYLVFNECPQGHEKKLTTASFCKVRLCPMCAWRRSLVVFAQLNKIIHVAASRRKLKFAFLTLTVRNVGADQLAPELDKLFHAWHKLMKRTEVKKALVGWFRGLEVTHNLENDTYHPHFHVLLVVSPSYFSGQQYISQARWADLWKESLDVDYTPIVHIQKVKPKREGQTVQGAVAEIGKYAVKEEDYLTDNLDQTDSAVSVLDAVLPNRRLVAYGGILREIRKELKLADAEEADLIHVDDENPEVCHCSVCQSELMKQIYTWHFGFKNYVKGDLRHDN